MRATDERVVVAGGCHLEDRVPDAVALCLGIALDETLAVERCEQPPRRAAVEPDLRRELGDAERARALRHCFQQRGGAVDRLNRPKTGRPVAAGRSNVRHGPSFMLPSTRRASRPSAPSAVTSNGFTSSSASHGARAARWESPDTALAAAATSSTGLP